MAERETYRCHAKFTGVSWVLVSVYGLLFSLLTDHRFYFPGMLIGPYLVFADYTALVYETVFVNSPAKSGAAVRQTMPAGRKRTAFSVMLRGLVCLGLYVVFGPKFNFSVLLEESWKAKNLATQYVSLQKVTSGMLMQYI
jgi:hypothetical protein